jgi:hypothetical protein
MTTSTLSQTPSRSLDQRMEALNRANQIRVRRAQLKRDLKGGQVRIADVIADPPDEVLTAKVYDMLVAVPRLGRVKATRLLTQCRISQSKTVGGLSDRQRAELLDLFRI